MNIQVLLLEITLIVVFFITGCKTPKSLLKSAPNPEKIVGIWLPACDSPKVLEFVDPSMKPIVVRKETRMTFNADGSFRIENIHKALLGGPFPEFGKEMVSAEGKWHIDKYYGYYIVALKFDEKAIKEINISDSYMDILVGKDENDLTISIEYDVETSFIYEFVKKSFRKCP